MKKILRHQPTKEDIITVLQRVAARSEDGRASLRAFKEETGWGRYWFDRIWPMSGYAGACEAAGVQPGAIIGVERAVRVSDEDLTSRFAEAVKEYNGIPSRKRLRAITRMGESTFLRGDSYDDAKRRLIRMYLDRPDTTRLGSSVDEIMRVELERLDGVRSAHSSSVSPSRVRTSQPTHAVQVPKDFIESVRGCSDRGEEDKRQLVVEFFCKTLRYKKSRVKSEHEHNDVRVHNRQDQPWLVVEVKKSLDNDSDRRAARRQGFDYAHGAGMRIVVISDGDYYEVFDRCLGERLRYDEMQKGSFRLTTLRSRDADLVNLLAAER